jgi:F-type H+-transporting ATPase subunit gamma
MASTRQLKSRIKSVKSTKQITKAMQLVSASKMRRAQEATSKTALYTQAAQELLTHLSRLTEVKSDPLFTKRKVKSRLIILVTSDRGLAGAYNSNVLRLYTNQIKEDDAKGISTKTIAIGRKGSHFISRLKGVESLGAFEHFPERPTGSELKPIMNIILEQFRSEAVDAVDLIYTDYINSLKQTPTLQRVLPAGFAETEVSDSVANSAFEPSAEEVLEQVTERLMEAQIFQALLDAVASEHSMRMVAMKNATDNATELIDDLTLAMNKVRQASITQELAEISGGAEAMK